MTVLLIVPVRQDGGSLETYLRVDRWEPKVLVWMEAAGWWCLSLFLIRRVTPPSLPGTRPIACFYNVSTRKSARDSLCPLSEPTCRVDGGGGSVCGSVPCWQWSPHSASCQLFASKSAFGKHTLRLYRFLRFKGSREN
jgi:hypothetical protein